MAIDRAQVGEFAIEAIDALAEHYDGQEGVELVDVMLVAAFNRAEDDESDVLYYSTETKTYRNIGLLRGAQLAAEGGS